MTRALDIVRSRRAEQLWRRRAALTRHDQSKLGFRPAGSIEPRQGGFFAGFGPNKTRSAGTRDVSASIPFSRRVHLKRTSLLFWSCPECWLRRRRRCLLWQVPLSRAARAVPAAASMPLPERPAGPAVVEAWAALVRVFDRVCDRGCPACPTAPAASAAPVAAPGSRRELFLWVARAVLPAVPVPRRRRRAVRPTRNLTIQPLTLFAALAALDLMEHSRCVAGRP